MGVLKNVEMVEETTTTTGTANLVLTGAVVGRRTFAAALSAGDYIMFRLASDDGNYYVIGRGQFMADGTLRRLGAERLWYFNGTAWVNENSAFYSLPAGTKRVAVIQGGSEAPVSTAVSPTQAPAIDIDAGANYALAWGRLALVEGGQYGMALGDNAKSNAGGVAIGVNAISRAETAIAGPFGEVQSTGKGSVALAGAVVRDAYSMMIGAYPSRDSTGGGRKSQGGWITRGVQTVSTTPQALKFFCEVENAGYYYDLQIFGNRNGAAGGVFAGCYAARLRAAIIGVTSGVPGIVHAAVTDELRVGPYIGAIPTPAIAAGSAQDWTVTVTGNADENWTWTVAGIAICGVINS